MTRVEGRGAATIHDVTLSMEDERVPKSSAKLEELLTTREDGGDALARCEQALSSLRQYLGSLTVQNLPVTQLELVLHQYEATGARLDARKKELTRELQRIDAEIAAERTQIAIPPEHNRLRNKAAIGVFAQTPGNVEIALIYGPCARLKPRTVANIPSAVPHASWTAFYDIRVDMDTKESPVELIYKAAIKQNTGEVSLPRSALIPLANLFTSPGTMSLCSSRPLPRRSDSASLSCPLGISISTDLFRLLLRRRRRK
jgi:hypothetical protein